MYIITDNDNFIIDKFVEEIELKDYFPVEIINRIYKIEKNDFEIGDKYINGEIIKPNKFYFISNNDNEFVSFEKLFEENKDEHYHKITKAKYNECIASGVTYIYKNGELQEYVPPITKDEKFKLLEQYISHIKDIGVEYNGKIFKCDSEAETNLLQSLVMIDSLLPLTWFTRNGEQGFIIFNTKEEFMQFVAIISNKMKEIKEKNYAYKYAIEQAQTQEELDAIVFE